MSQLRVAASRRVPVLHHVRGRCSGMRFQRIFRRACGSHGSCGGNPMVSKRIADGPAGVLEHSARGSRHALFPCPAPGGRTAFCHAVDGSHARRRLDAPPHGSERLQCGGCGLRCGCRLGQRRAASVRFVGVSGRGARRRPSSRPPARAGARGVLERGASRRRRTDVAEDPSGCRAGCEPGARRRHRVVAALRGSLGAAARGGGQGRRDCGAGRRGPWRGHIGALGQPSCSRPIKHLVKRCARS